jgi:hypothetical protein
MMVEIPFYRMSDMKVMKEITRPRPWTYPTLGQVVTLYHEGFTPAEIAKQLGRTTGAICTQLYHLERKGKL